MCTTCVGARVFTVSCMRPCFLAYSDAAAATLLLLLLQSRPDNEARRAATKAAGEWTGEEVRGKSAEVEGEREGDTSGLLLQPVKRAAKTHTCRHTTH